MSKELPLDRAVDWYLDGKPITYRDCIRNQCGPVALSYAERIQELALQSTAIPEGYMLVKKERLSEMRSILMNVSHSPFVRVAQALQQLQAIEFDEEDRLEVEAKKGKP